MADTILGIPNGVLTKGEQKIADPLFGPKTSTTDELLEKIRSSLEGTRRNTSPMRNVAEKQKEDFKNRGKLKVTASDMIRLSGPYSFGYMYLGDILRESTEGITEGFTSGLKTLIPKKSTKKDNGPSSPFERETRSNSIFLQGLKKGLRDTFGLNEAAAAGQKGGIFSTIVQGLIGASTGGTIANFIKGGTWVKAIPIAGLVLGIITAAIDGIRGYFKSKEWGTTKIGGIVGGALGDTNSGLTGAFRNMGKWAGIGAGIGLIGGPPGVIAGGIIGAALGALLGWIGGEKIAKFSDKIGKWFADKWNGFLGKLGEGWEITKQFGRDVAAGFQQMKAEWSAGWNNTKAKIGGLWNKAGGILVAGYTWVKDTTFAVGQKIIDWFVNLKNKVGSWLGEKWDNIKTGAINIALGIRDFFVETPAKVAGWVSEKWNDLKEGFVKIVTGVKDFFVEAPGKIAAWASEKWNSLKESFSTITSRVGAFFSNTFTKMGDWVSEKWASLKEDFFGITSQVSTFFTDVFIKIGGWIAEKWTALKEGFGNIATGVKSFFLGVPAKITEWGAEKWDSLKEGFFGITTKVKDWFAGTKVGEWGAEKADEVKAGFTNITNGVKNWFADRDIDISSLASDSVDSIKNFTSNMFDKVKGWFGARSKEVEDEAAEKEGGFLSGFFSKVKGVFDFSPDTISPAMITDLLKEKLVTPISNFFGNIGSFFGYLKSYFDDGIIGGLSALAKDVVKGEFNEGFEEFKKAQQVIINMPAAPAPIQEPESEDNRPWLKKLFRIEDGILKGNFELQRSLSRGSLFNNNSNSVVTDEGDDLYLMASTNPARDALTDSVDALNSMIERLAEAIEGYKPQINNTLAPVQNQESVLRSLLARG
jgi:hypothetical protein